MASASFQQWRSPPPAETPSLEPSDLPGILSPKAGTQSIGITGRNGVDSHHQPSFLPPCEHGKDGDMHAHAFDLLSLSGSVKEEPAVPSSVPATSVLSATRPVNNIVPGSSTGSGPKARRMSSSTTGVLGRGKLGLMGDALGLSTSKEVRPGLSAHGSSFAAVTPIPTRRPGMGSSPTPQLFDFAKTDRRPSHQHRTTNTSVVLPISSPPPTNRPTSGLAASLPAFNGSTLNDHRTARKLSTTAAVPTGDDMELDMEFDGEEEEDDDDDGDDGSGGRSGSAELELDPDDDGEIKPSQEWDKFALGKGSGGVKGRRKGMVFKCENCKKEYRHPSCLVKHRWEHSPHWREPTQISMSKHQQVQMLEAAAILAHLDPTGRSLPTDKSLWPAILSPGEMRRLGDEAEGAASIDMLRSPQNSTIAPVTPGSLPDGVVSSTSSLLNSSQNPRKSSPGSDSTSSEGPVTGLLSPRADSVRPLGIVDAGRRGSSSIASSFPQPGTPQSIGSLPDMTGLHFHSGSIPSNHNNGGFGGGANGVSGLGASPIPNRGGPNGRTSLSGPGAGGANSLSLSLTTRAGMIGGGMFGVASNGVKIQTEVPRSSIRSGADDEDEIEEEEDDNLRGVGSSRARLNGHGHGHGIAQGHFGLNLHPQATILGNGIGNGGIQQRRSTAGSVRGGRKSSSEETEDRGDDWGDAMDMEL